MPWDIDKGKEGLNPSRRFDWDAEGNEWVDLRLVSDADENVCFKSIGAKEKVEWKTDPKTRQMQRCTYFDATDEQRRLFEEEIWDRRIANWNLEKPDGELIPCTRENKTLMMREAPAFRKWIDSSTEQMSEDVLSHKKEVEKN